jgi:hypothetical protein
MRNLHVYWADGRANFGDSVTPELIQFLLDKKVVWANKWRADLLSIGSLLGWALFKTTKGGCAGSVDEIRMRIRRFISRPVCVFGTGFLFDPLTSPVKPILRRVPHFFAVRGRLTYNILKRMNIPIDDGVALGDPGLLFPSLWADVHHTVDGGRAYIPHESEWDTQKLVDFASRHPEIRLIDVRESPKEVFRAISSSSEIFSSSLHGLIAADSIGIPNRWVRLEIPGRTFEQDRFKFDDYYSAFNVVRNPCEYADISKIDIGPQIQREQILERRAILKEALNNLKNFLRVNS